VGQSSSDTDSSVLLGKSSKVFRTLLVEDNPGDARLIETLLAHARGTRFHLEWARRLKTALHRLANNETDVILLDLSLPPDSRGLDTFEQVHATARDVPIVVLTGSDDEAQAIQAVERGAQDYLVKGQVDSNVLVRSLRFAIERNRRRRAERALHDAQEGFRLARQIQEHLFPAEPPCIEGFDVFGATYPAEATGGDYFDYIPMVDQSTALVVGDVIGHGFGPALLMATVRGYLRALAQTHENVSGILRLLNRLLARDLEDEHFVSLFLARLDPRSRELTYASAGHPAGYILGAAGDVKASLPSTAPLLGLKANGDFPAASPVTLAPGDTVVLLTDGVLDAGARVGTPFGIDRTLQIVRSNLHRPARAIISALYDAVCAYVSHTPRHDDITTIVMKVAAAS
jgi:serine phosphatase RsbU (regulator of sigma subunit)